jgi:hypothetical protein
MHPRLREHVDGDTFKLYLHGKEISIGELGCNCIERDVPEALFRLL